MKEINSNIFNQISQNIDTGVLVTDKDNKILFFNNWVKERTLLNPDHILNKNLEDAFPEINGTRVSSTIIDAKKYGLPAIVSNIFNKSPFPLYSDLKLKKIIYQNINIIPFKSNGDSYVITQITDVSASVKREKALEQQALKRKEAEKKLMSALDKLKEASAIKSDFLASMSHEIRTPINGIVGISNLLKKTTLTHEQDNYIETIDDSVSLLMTVINDILDFSKLESGKLALNTTTFEFKTIIKSILDLLTVDISNNNINTETKFDNESRGLFIGDDNRIKQVLLNLISNAIKFTKNGNVLINFQCLDTKEQTSTIKVSVTDTGIGISDDIQKKLFDKFTQADSSTTREYGGTGLGLAISKNLIELMHGSIGVESIKNKGSTFWFIIELPIANADVSIKIKPETNLSIPKLTGKALLVDDVAVNRMIASAMLEELGLEVVTAENGLEAYEKAISNTFTFILMDCQMPVMDGFESTKKIREAETGKLHTPIIALTALAMKGDNQRCLDAGMDDYITKPYEVEDLVSAINRCVY